MDLAYAKARVADYVCPINHEIILDLVMLGQHYFERSAIERHIPKGRTAKHPITNKEFKHTDILPAPIAAKNELIELRKYFTANPDEDITLHMGSTDFDSTAVIRMYKSGDWDADINYYTSINIADLSTTTIVEDANRYMLSILGIKNPQLLDALLRKFANSVREQLSDLAILLAADMVDCDNLDMLIECCKNLNYMHRLRRGNFTVFGEICDNPALTLAQLQHCVERGADFTAACIDGTPLKVLLRRTKNAEILQYLVSLGFAGEFHLWIKDSALLLEATRADLAAGLKISKKTLHRAFNERKDNQLVAALVQIVDDTTVPYEDAPQCCLLFAVCMFKLRESYPMAKEKARNLRLRCKAGWSVEDYIHRMDRDWA